MKMLYTAKVLKQYKVISRILILVYIDYSTSSNQCYKSIVSFNFQLVLSHQKLILDSNKENIQSDSDV